MMIVKEEIQTNRWHTLCLQFGEFLYFSIQQSGAKMHIACQDTDQYVSEAPDGNICQLRSGVCKAKNDKHETATVNFKSLYTSSASCCMYKCCCNFLAT